MTCTNGSSRRSKTNMSKDEGHPGKMTTRASKHTRATKNSKKSSSNGSVKQRPSTTKTVTTSSLKTDTTRCITRQSSIPQATFHIRMRKQVLERVPLRALMTSLDRMVRRQKTKIAANRRSKSRYQASLMDGVNTSVTRPKTRRTELRCAGLQ